MDKRYGVSFSTPSNGRGLIIRYMTGSGILASVLLSPKDNGGLIISGQISGPKGVIDDE